MFPGLYVRRLERRTEVHKHWVKPSEITHLAKHLPRVGEGMEHVGGGDWDERSPRFEDYDMVQAFKAVALRGGRWEDQPFFERVLGRIDAGEPLWDCRSREELQERLRGLDLLYREIKTRGYHGSNNFDEVTVAVGRHGDLFLYDGAHRLAIAQILALPAIPVRVAVRHPEWARFKAYILEYADSHKRGAYAPLLHPDLEWISSYYGHKRFELIRGALTAQRGRLLDIGCNWGYFCDRFEEQGFDCVGVEKDEGNFYILEKLKRARRKRFETFCGSIFDYRGRGGLDFDVVLALAIFHHFLKTKETLERLRVFLSELRPREMYFIPHKRSESQMDGAYWNPSEEELVGFVLKHARLKEALVIGQGEDGRPIFKLSG
ncbi:MAG: class I SAM-dependent methyltransferase [Planctomycetes bacterium]|nr:class I SAM-dependent methyltransferase [Planctomycetota bacterium]